MRATQQLKYAIYGIFDIAYNGGDRPVSVLEIGARQGIPPRYLEQIFQKLRRGGLVTSKRGPGGGYQLSRPPESISLADVVTAVQGEVLALPDNGGQDQPNGIDFVWELMRERLDHSLRGHSIADLCREAAQRGLDRAGEPAMYHI